MSKLLALTTPGNGGGTSGGPASIIGKIEAPPAIRDLVNLGGAGGLSQVLTNAIILIYQIAVILFIFMVLFSALQWIISGGDKEKVASARSRLTSAVVGLFILGLAWVITSVLGSITGIKFPTK